MVFSFKSLIATVSISLLGALCVSSASATQTIKVGVTAGPAAEILEQVIPIAKKKNLEIKLYEFQDYVRPHAALADGELDANVFSTKVWLDAQNHDRGYNLVPVGRAFTLPMAFYSKKFKNFNEVPAGSTVGIPNDRTMVGRALLLLEANNIIKLKEGVGLIPSTFDITSNPKKLKFLELDAAMLPHSLNDLAVSAINGNYAALAGLNPLKDGLIAEDKDAPYVCYIVVQNKDKNASWVKDLVTSVQDPAVKKFIDNKYQGSVIAGF
ncbi:MAG: MetQ/NlpA family ABC transporter substrate-binding protein [Burkholderiaceae bacterium]|nr:MetQ/NlpA family ABC transporter substrate-binding protein [Burkholderiaceae bacterium]